jgi:predicted membrane protein
MHPPAGPAWLVWLETSAVAEAMRQWLWLYPVVEIVHIVGFAVLVGAAVMFDLRLLGVSSALPVTGMERHLLRGARLSLLLVVPSGLLMFSAHATEMADNPAFRLKLALLLAAAVNAGVFHRVPFRSVRHWDRNAPAPPAARVAAALSLILWIGVITCGRLLAYL